MIWHDYLDFIISISYFTIPASLLAIGLGVSKVENIPNLWTLQGFLAVGFIVSCGAGHMMEALGFHELHQAWGAVTAIFSVTEAVAIAMLTQPLIESVVNVLEGNKNGDVLDEVFEQGPGIGLFMEAVDSQGRPDLMILRYSRRGRQDIKIANPEGLLLGEVMPHHRETGLLEEYLQVLETGEKLTKNIEYHGDKISSAFLLIASKVNSIKPLLQIIWFDISREVSLRRKLEDVVAKDGLTGLYNRTFLDSRLTQAVAELKRNRTPFCLVSADLNKFKRINDTYGHQAGDQVLRKFADAISNNIRDSDAAARMGGDEFLILLPQSDERDGARIAERILNTFNSQMVLYRNSYIEVSASFGVAEAKVELFDGDRDPKDTITDQVDQAMYAAKSGKEGLHVYGDNTSALSILRLEARINDGLAKKEFELYYQPIIDLQTGKISGVEALVRWNHQDQILTPGAFLDVAEKSGLILELSKEIIRQGVEQAGIWNCDSDFKLAINLSASILEHPVILDTIIESVLLHKVKPIGLEFEVTETAPMLLTLDTLSLLQSIRQSGSHVSLDDTGAGDNGPIKLLKLIELNILTGIKIDIELVSRLSINSLPIIEGLIKLAKQNDLTVVAEGIEHEDVADKLLELGCDCGQGYFFAKPMPAAQLEKEWLKERMTHHKPWGGSFYVGYE